MLISKLHLLQFKNYEDQTFQFHQRFNCLVGLNGMGKTNVLDAIHYLAFTKSALNNTDSQNIMHDMNYFSVRGVFDAPNVEEVSCYFERGGGKTFKVNKLAPEKLAEHIGKIPLVITTPYDQGLILEGSEGRRKFVDGTISQFDGSFLKSLLKYQKTLRQRNAALKNSHTTRRQSLEALLDIYDEEIIQLSQDIATARAELTAGFEPFFVESYQMISGTNERATFSHQSQVLANSFPEDLRKSREKDLITQRTHVGCHKDDFIFKLNDHPLRKEGSQGQQKSFLLALKLAQYNLLLQKSGQKPILLLDDLFDKLDDLRIRQILEVLSDDTRFGQVIITDARIERIKNLFEQQTATKFFEISHGKNISHG